MLGIWVTIIRGRCFVQKRKEELTTPTSYTTFYESDTDDEDTSDDALDAPRNYSNINEFF